MAAPRVDPPLEFRLLGAVTVLHGEMPVALGPHPRAILAILLLHRGEIVSADRLVDYLWSDEPPKNAANSLQASVSRLRRALAAVAPGDELVVTAAPGYTMSVDPDSVDLYRFERLAARGADALKAGDSEAALATYDDALVLWRGAPLADFAYEEFARVAIARLDELRLSALEQRAEAGLALGRHRELVPELEALVAAHPLREALRAHLMLALYRSDRQADALQVYQSARETLVDELGIDPSPALQRLERAILNHDEALDLRQAPEAEAAPPTARRSVLLAPTADRALPALLAASEGLAHSEAEHELLLARILDPGADVSKVSAELNALRGELLELSVGVRVVAYTSESPAEDVIRLATQQDVDLVLLDDLDAVARGGSFSAVVTAALGSAPSDVGVLVGEGRPGRDERFVLVPFGASDNDWAALELGGWSARGRGLPLKLVGTGAGADGRRDASRLLANASLAVQYLAGVPCEPLLAEATDREIATASSEAALVVLGLSDRWRTEGLGPLRSAVAGQSAAPVVAVRRGPRPSGLSPDSGLTRFTWSLAGAGRRHPGATIDTADGTA